MKKLIRLALVAAMIAGPAVAQVKVFYPFVEWEKLDERARSLYIAGAFDSMVIFSGPDERQVRASFHYSACLARAGVTSGQLAESVRAHARVRTELQKESMPAVLLNYLIALCGAPPQR
jgi:hypothetical protein